MHLTALYVYPIKSAKGTPLTTARLGDRGIELDRRWMVVDKTGKFLSQRKIPRMALIHVQIQSENLLIQAAGMEDLFVPLQIRASNTLQVKVWDDTLSALEVGDEAATWFSRMLGQSCRLVQMPDQSERSVDRRYSAKKTLLSFADSFPLHLISQPSLDDLNSRLAEPVPVNRFRPNIVVTGCAPYEEDSWQRIRIGSVLLRIAKPCSRCTTPTVNQDSGERGSEPILTLKSYRKRSGKVYFGQKLVCENLGDLTVGDEVALLDA